MEHRLGQIRLVVMGFLEGRLESLMEEEREEGTLSSSGSEGSAASGDGSDGQDGDMVSHMRITPWIFETITNIPAPEPGWKTED